MNPSSRTDILLEDYTASLRPTVAVVDLSALRKNLSVIRRIVGHRVGILAVVKADGYGHGMVPVAEAAAKWGVQGFAVGTADEALELRESRAIPRLPVLVMGPTLPDDAPALQAAGVAVAIGSETLLRAHLQVAWRRGESARLHVKIDTGMGRSGFSVGDLSWLEALRHARSSLEGMFTHFACSESLRREDVAHTVLQRQRFESLVRLAYQAGLRPVYHAANSGAVLRHRDAHYQLVRPGILMYGNEPSAEYLAGAHLLPVLRIQSKLLAIHHHRAGDTISYGRTHTLPRDTPVGIVPVGYGDGFPRTMSNKADMLVHGQRVPVIGRVCMDQTLIDLSSVPQARPGDDVVILGEQGEHRISLDEMAEVAGTIPYEITCQLSKRVPRVYLDDDRETIHSGTTSPSAAPPPA